MAERFLLPQEIMLATSVFYGTLPYHLIRIADDLGIGDRPWCAPPQISWGNYVIHLGAAGFVDATLNLPLPMGGGVRSIFIHELVHVWQGHHNAFSSGGGYFVTAAMLQCQSTIFGTEIYASSPGLPWFRYNPEQQANIVMDWFSMGRPTSGPLYGYIELNIRKGRPLYDNSVPGNSSNNTALNQHKGLQRTSGSHGST